MLIRSSRVNCVTPWKTVPYYKSKYLQNFWRVTINKQDEILFADKKRKTKINWKFYIITFIFIAKISPQVATNVMWLFECVCRLFALLTRALGLRGEGGVFAMYYFVSANLFPASAHACPGTNTELFVMQTSTGNQFTRIS